MRSAPRTEVAEGAAVGAGANGSAAAPFAGTDNPHHLRALAALLTSPMPREMLDRRAGCSNGPDLVADLRRRGLDVPCERTPCIDRDGSECKRGIYYLTERDRARVNRWLRLRAERGAR